MSHAKKGKHIPNIEFFNSIYRIIPQINAQWLYMGVGEMFSDAKYSIDNARKEFLERVSKLKKDLTVHECNDELEKAENEIKYLKKQVDDKNVIIELLKSTKVE